MTTLGQVMGFNLPDLGLVTIASILVTLVSLWMLATSESFRNALADSKGRWALVGLLVVILLGKELVVPDWIGVPLNFIISVVVYPLAFIGALYSVYSGLLLPFFQKLAGRS